MAGPGFLAREADGLAAPAARPCTKPHDPEKLTLGQGSSKNPDQSPARGLFHDQAQNRFADLMAENRGLVEVISESRGMLFLPRGSVQGTFPAWDDGIACLDPPIYVPTSAHLVGPGCYELPDSTRPAVRQQ